MESLLQPIVQYGFAGMCAILLGILIWMIRRVLDAFKSNGEIITANTNAINTLNNNMTEQRAEIGGLKEELYRRPCMVDSNVRVKT